MNASICQSVYMSICLSVIMLSPPKRLQRSSTKLATSLPLMVSVCKSNIFFLYVRQHYFFHASSLRSVCTLGCLLLNYWMEFNKIQCYITSPHGKGVREQYNFSVHLSFHVSVVHPSVLHAILLNHWGIILPNLLYHFPSWWGCLRVTLFVHLSIWHVSVVCPYVRYAISS